MIANTPNDETKFALCQELHKLNFLTTFPIIDAQIEAYAEKIFELDKRITPKVIWLIINSAIVGKIKINVSDGLRCIFDGLNKLKDFVTNVYGEFDDWNGKTKIRLNFGKVLELYPEEIEKLTINDLEEQF